ncbi:MAG: 7-carboxy-7-deazaguanine synthase QueE [Gammaproteobacteria bacterium]|nr:7-carboxy-7-deazaguanine synthase QueE [Gammaproteobacteria bacterium]
MRVTEIFLSLQGEAQTVGWPTVFVRLTGCPLRCRYCDTAYAFHGGEWKSCNEVLSEIGRHRVRHVCVTGGEPLAQKNCLTLLTRLCDAGYDVSIETSGALDIAMIDPRVVRVMDLKTPGSGESDRNLIGNLDALRPGDAIKFVICDRADYEWSKRMVHEYSLGERCEVLFSPSWQQLDGAALADWILADELPVRFQVQLHKLLWGDVPGR